MIQSDALPLIFDIRRFALDDGPGIRTTVFLKGCPLACCWCHNPESIRIGREISFQPDLCIECGECELVCPEGAIRRDMHMRIARDRCSLCGMCAEACPSTALKVMGRHAEAGELVELLLRDRVLFDTSGGGVTFSGGEPTLHLPYLVRVCRELKKKGVHIVIQTSGMFDLDAFERELLPSLDLIFFDLKLMDSLAHGQFTGLGNERIVHNFSALSRHSRRKIIPRTPLVPGITDTGENLEALAQFLRALGHDRHVLLPFNSGGASKRHFVGSDPQDAGDPKGRRT